MLVRVTGANGGIREYLENGQKQGREYSRAVLDERVVLSGDLAITDRIISEMVTDADRYLHITLAFKEDEVSQETLLAVTRDFERFAFSAYQADEYNIYAEAHLPKIKSYVNKKTGEFIERKPHIHIVIPKTNLFSGNYLSPFGRYEQNERFVEAFQEYANHQYGLASPKDNRRIEITSASEMIARYKGDLFAAQGRELKERLLLAMLEKDVRRYEDFEALAGTFGELRTRNAGRPDSYLNLKAPGEAKGANLREYVFSREFIELPDPEKRKRLTAEIVRQYESAGMARKPPAALEKTLRDWHDRRALEIKYLNSGNRKQYAAYRAADPEARRAMLAGLRDGFYAKHQPKDVDHERRDPSEDLGRIDDNLRAASRQLQAAGRHIEQVRRAAAGAGKLADRRNRRALAAAVQRRASDQGLDAGERSVEREADNVAAQLAHDERERIAQARADDRDLFKTIKRTLDANRLLVALSHSHGVIPAKYEVTKGKDGGDRIRAGDRHLNVSDFLTKELHLSWQEAAQILREAHEQQAASVDVQVSQEPRRDLWRAYQAWNNERSRTMAQRWTDQRESEKARRAAIKQGFQTRRT
ncbi:hypothetical protein PP724_22825, partial [Ralstonia solanacearum]|nr:hypothetical protein [Ralstonia solanacearum]